MTDPRDVEGGLSLFLISQTKNNDYDTYDSAVVCVKSAEDAKNFPVGDIGQFGSWTVPEFVSVKYLGEAAPGVEPGIICASFNAG